LQFSQRKGPSAISHNLLYLPVLKPVQTIQIDPDLPYIEFSALEQGVYAALETYSNVHRGSGHNSLVSTHLFEQARDIVLEYLGLNKGKYMLIFCTPSRAAMLQAQLKSGSYQMVSSQDFGLPLGVRALAVDRKALPGGIPFQTGGGTARLVSPGWVVWADAPDRFEAGTPAIMNVIAFARALRLVGRSGNKSFGDSVPEKLTAAEILYHDELEEYSGQKLLDELRQTLIGRDVMVPTAEDARPFINLDNGASTPTFTPVWKAFCQAWRQPGEVQQEIIRETRLICAGVLAAPQDVYDVIFTSNTTEAINLAAESLGKEPGQDTEPVVLNTLLEHTSNDLPWRNVPHFSMIRLLVDAAQLVAHRRVDMESCGIDYLAFSAHKAYAPFGTGVLVARKGLLHFSPAELALINSSGEENAGGIAALGKALALLQRIGLDLIRDEEQALTGRALRGLAEIPGLSIYGVKDTDSPGFARKGGVIVFTLKDMFSNVVANKLALHGGIGVRYGCHCSHILVKHLLHISPFLERFQKLIATLFHRVNFPRLVRVSLGIENSEKEIDALIQVLGKIAAKPRTSPPKDLKQQMNDFTRDAARRAYDNPS
jgi:selenocysteine lyase/cysteine desulfurase